MHLNPRFPGLFRSKRLLLTWTLSTAILGIISIMWLAHNVSSADPYLPATSHSFIEDIVYVCATTGSDQSGCGTKEQPCASILYGISQADIFDTIRVAVGTYTQNLTLTKAVNLSGGWSGDWKTQTLAAYSTTVDIGVDGDGAVLVIEGNHSPQIEGFTFVNGHLDDHAGGGIRIIGGAAPTLRFNWILNNWAYKCGGGIYVGSHGTSSPEIIHNTIRGNTSDKSSGGGICVTERMALIQDNTILDNKAATYGGGIYITNSLSTIQGNVITGNRAITSGGGIYLTGDAAPQVLNNEILSNTAVNKSGGGIFVSGSGALSCTILGNKIIGNVSGSSEGGGGGIYVNDRSVLIQGNVINDNKAMHSDGGGIYLTGNATAKLLDNYILDNEAKHEGGGVLIRSKSSVYFENNIVADNQVNNEGKGCGLYIHGSSPHLLHTTVARNAGGYGRGVYITEDDSDYSTVAMTNTILVRHNVGIYVATGNTGTLTATLWGTGTWGNGDDWDGDGTIITGSVNIWGHPDFLAPDAGSYHIGESSAAIDAGIDVHLFTDIDGDPRPLHSGYDIGADEWAPIYLPLVLRCWPFTPPTLLPIDNTNIDGSYTVCWSGCSLAFTLEEATNADFKDPFEVYSGPNTSHTVGGKSPGHYYYRAEACSDGECSNWSKVEMVSAWWENEDNGGLSQANGPLIPAMNYYGHPDDDDWDCFKINVERDETITVDLANHTGNGVWLELIDASGAIVRAVKKPPYHIEYPGPAGRYNICIYTKSGHNSGTPYILTATFSSKAALRTIHDRYVTARNDGQDQDWELIGDTTKIGDPEVFTLIWLGDNTIALKTFYEKYAAAMDGNEDWMIKAKTETLSDCGVFTLIDLSNGMIALKTCHEKYVSARKHDESWLLKQVDELNASEKFVLVSPPEIQNHQFCPGQSR